MKEILILILANIFVWYSFLQAKRKTKQKNENERTMFYFKSLDLRVLIMAFLVSAVTVYYAIKYIIDNWI